MYIIRWKCIFKLLRVNKYYKSKISLLPAVSYRGASIYFYWCSLEKVKTAPAAHRKRFNKESIVVAHGEKTEWRGGRAGWLASWLYQDSNPYPVRRGLISRCYLQRSPAPRYIQDEDASNFSAPSINLTSPPPSPPPSFFSFSLSATPLFSILYPLFLLFY